VDRNVHGRARTDRRCWGYPSPAVDRRSRTSRLGLGNAGRRCDGDVPGRAGTLRPPRFPDGPQWKLLDEARAGRTRLAPGHHLRPWSRMAHRRDPGGRSVERKPSRDRDATRRSRSRLHEGRPGAHPGRSHRRGAHSRRHRQVVAAAREGRVLPSRGGRVRPDQRPPPAVSSSSPSRDRVPSKARSKS
jgi:hypothetical protein